MTTYKHCIDDLQVTPDPEHAGKHPLHDSRFITTAGASFEERPEGEWDMPVGHIVAKMTDCEHQAQYARLFAHSKRMLWMLRSNRAWIAQAGGDTSTMDLFLSQFTDIA